MLAAMSAELADDWPIVWLIDSVVAACSRTADAIVGLEFAEPARDLDDLADRRGGRRRVLLDALHLRGDVVGGRLGLLGQFLHLAGHHREALPRLAGPGRLDRRVQGQQVGLLGDRGDRLDDVADLPAGVGEPADHLVGGPGGPRGSARRPGPPRRRVPAIFWSDAAHRRGAGRDRAHVAGDLVGGRDDLRRTAPRSPWRSTMIWIAVLVSARWRARPCAAESPISRTVAAILSTNRLNERPPSVNSSCPLVSSRWVRSPSPSAMSARRSCRAPSGRMIDSASRIGEHDRDAAARGCRPGWRSRPVRWPCGRRGACAAASFCRAPASSRSTPPRSRRTGRAPDRRPDRWPCRPGPACRPGRRRSPGRPWPGTSAKADRIVATSACSAAVSGSAAIMSTSVAKLAIDARNAARSGAVSAVASGARGGCRRRTRPASR